MDNGFVLPGLFNMHSHLSMAFPSMNSAELAAISSLRAYRRGYDALNAGVTTVRTQGELHRVDISLRKMINEGWVQGPRILAGGKGVGVSGGHGSEFGRIGANGPDEFLKAARTELAFGADHVKIFITGGISASARLREESEMTEEEMEAVVRVAGSKGTYVTAHAGGSEPILKAVGAGVTCFEHGYVLNRKAAKAIKEADGYLVPTLGVTRSPVWMREHGTTEQGLERVLSAADTHLQSIKTAIEEGVKLLNGTDIPPGDLNDGINATVREIEFLTHAGLSFIEAIRASTICAAELCGISDRVGLAEPGYVADLIAVPSNPLSDIRSMRQIRFVMKDGQIVRDDLHGKRI